MEAGNVGSGDAAMRRHRAEVIRLERLEGAAFYLWVGVPALCALAFAPSFWVAIPLAVVGGGTILHLGGSVVGALAATLLLLACFLLAGAGLAGACLAGVAWLAGFLLTYGSHHVRKLLLWNPPGRRAVADGGGPAAG